MLHKHEVYELFIMLRVAGVQGGPDLGKVEQAEAICNLWVDLLSDMDHAELSLSVRQFLNSEESKWWPQPGILRKYSPRQKLEKLDSEVDDSDVAWGKILGLVRQYGYYQSEKATSEMTDVEKCALQACGGFQAICQCETDSLFTHRASFRSAYKAMATRAKIGEERVRLGLAGPKEQRQQLEHKPTIGDFDSLGKVLEMIPGGKRDAV